MPGRETAARCSGVALPQQAVPPPRLPCSAGSMTADSGIGGPAVALTGRLSERDALDRFVADVRAGEGRALVVRGEPGVGKTVLLDYLAGRASGCLVARSAGVQSEMELAFAGLHQLCAPMVDHAEVLPGPQREALRAVFGLSVGPPPDRFLVGLAVLGLLSETARERPLVCVVDAPDAVFLVPECRPARVLGQECIDLSGGVWGGEIDHGSCLSRGGPTSPTLRLCTIARYSA
jgi:hypothetical protein